MKFHLNVFILFWDKRKLVKLCENSNGIQNNYYIVKNEKCLEKTFV